MSGTTSRLVTTEPYLDNLILPGPRLRISPQGTLQLDRMTLGRDAIGAGGEADVLGKLEDAHFLYLGLQ